MKLDAVFVLKNVMIKKIIELDTEKRMDCILGLTDDYPFIDSVFDMIDYGSDGSLLYEFIQMEINSPVFCLENMIHIPCEEGFLLYVTSLQSNEFIISSLKKDEKRAILSNIKHFCKQSKIPYRKANGMDLFNQYMNFMKLAKDSLINDNGVMFLFVT